MNRSHRPYRLAVIVIALSAVAVSACSLPDDQVTTLDRSDLPPALRPAPSTTADADGMVVFAAGDVAVYWIRDRRLVPEGISFQSPPDPQRLSSLLEQGPGESIEAAGARSVVSGAGAIVAVSAVGDRIEVELAPSFAEVTGTDQSLALGQIVATMTTIPGISQVLFRQSGDVVDVPIQDGTLVRRPLTRADFSTLL